MSSLFEHSVQKKHHPIFRRYSGLVDCALYFTHTFAERGNTYRAATTLLLDRSAVRLVEGGGRGGEGRWEEEEGEVTSSLASVLSEAQLNGIPIETVVYTWHAARMHMQIHKSCHPNLSLLPLPPSLPPSLPHPSSPSLPPSFPHCVCLKPCSGHAVESVMYNVHCR